MCVLSKHIIIPMYLKLSVPSYRQSKSGWFSPLHPFTATDLGVKVKLMLLKTHKLTKQITNLFVC